MPLSPNMAYSIQRETLGGKTLNQSLFRGLLVLNLLGFLMVNWPLAGAAPLLPKGQPDTLQIETLPYAKAHSDCAPWDGAALTFVFQKRPFTTTPSYPQLEVHIYELPLVLKKWIPFHTNDKSPKSGSSMERGNAIFRPTKPNNISPNYQEVSVDLWIDAITPKIIEGKIRVLSPVDNKPGSAHTFRAPISSFVAMCG
ncbi:MAG: hypothetical protein K2X66_05185 [Cyanobacteria bacterium]|nr:hypothetical protein [Cyanobacteriota bacterium]